MEAMKLEYPGLIRQVLPSGRVIWRVRPKGEHKTRIQIHAEPGTDEFLRQYFLARRGEKPDPTKKPSEQSIPKTIGWLVHLYFEYLESRVASGEASHKTLKKKRNLLSRLLKEPNKRALIPAEKLLEMQDQMIATPAQADAFIEAVAVMYDWAVKRKYVPTNTARGLPSVYKKGGGAIPWKVDDVNRFFAYHRPGSKAHVAMSVLLWTGCRVEDLTILGPRYECVIDGMEALCWTPLKKGSSMVTIPLLPPLREATRAPKVLGETYVLGRGGMPFASGDSMSAMFKRWCKDAGLAHLSAHGVRKGLAELLAELGCTQYEVMAILGHSEAKTSEVYTRRVERWKLAKGALERVRVNAPWR